MDADEREGRCGMSTTKKSKKGEPKTMREAADQAAADEKQAKLPITARDVRITRQEIELPHALAETEVEHVKGKVMLLEVEITALSKEHADLQTMARGKAKEISQKRADVSKLSAEAHTKTRKLVVGVRVEHDFAAAQLRYYRLDRGEINPETKERVGELYDTQPMPPEEREEAIFKPTSPDRVVLDEGTAEPTGDADEAVNAKGGDA